MAREDVKRALEAMMADGGTAGQLAEGDFSGVADLDLTSDEQLLVRDAAADLPDVSGFASDIFAKIGDIKGESMLSGQLGKWESPSAKFNLALAYALKQ